MPALSRCWSTSPPSWHPSWRTLGALDTRLKKLEDAPGTEGLSGKVEENTVDIDKLKDAAIEVAAYKKFALWFIGLGGTGGAAAVAAALSKLLGDTTAP